MTPLDYHTARLSKPTAEDLKMLKGMMKKDSMSEVIDKLIRVSPYYDIMKDLKKLNDP